MPTSRSSPARPPPHSASLGVPAPVPVPSRRSRRFLSPQHPSTASSPSSFTSPSRNRPSTPAVVSPVPGPPRKSGRLLAKRKSPDSPGANEITEPLGDAAQRPRKRALANSLAAPRKRRRSAPEREPPVDVVDDVDRPRHSARLENKRKRLSAPDVVPEAVLAHWRGALLNGSTQPRNQPVVQRSPVKKRARISATRLDGVDDMPAPPRVSVEADSDASDETLVDGHVSVVPAKNERDFAPSPPLSPVSTLSTLSELTDAEPEGDMAQLQDAIPVPLFPAYATIARCSANPIVVIDPPRPYPERGTRPVRLLFVYPHPRARFPLFPPLPKTTAPANSHVHLRPEYAPILTALLSDNLGARIHQRQALYARLHRTLSLNPTRVRALIALLGHGLGAAIARRQSAAQLSTRLCGSRDIGRADTLRRLLDQGLPARIAARQKATRVGRWHKRERRVVKKWVATALKERENEEELELVTSYVAPHPYACLYRYAPRRPTRLRVSSVLAPVSVSAPINVSSSDMDVVSEPAPVDTPTDGVVSAPLETSDMVQPQPQLQQQLPVFPKQHLQRWHMRHADHRMELPVWKWASLSRVEQSCQIFGVDVVRAVIAAEAAAATSRGASFSVSFPIASSPATSVSLSVSASTTQHVEDHDLDADGEYELDLEYEGFAAGLASAEAGARTGGLEGSDIGEQGDEDEEGLDGIMGIEDEEWDDLDVDLGPDVEADIAMDLDMDLDMDTESLGEDGNGEGDSDEDADEDGEGEGEGGKEGESSFQLDVTPAPGNGDDVRGREFTFSASPPSPLLQLSPPPPPSPSILPPSFSPVDSVPPPYANPNAYAYLPLPRLSHLPALCLREPLQPVRGLGTPGGDRRRATWLNAARTVEQTGANHVLEQAPVQSQLNVLPTALHSMQDAGQMQMQMQPLPDNMLFGMLGFEFGVGVGMGTGVGVGSNVGLGLGLGIGVGVGMGVGQDFGFGEAAAAAVPAPSPGVGIGTNMASSMGVGVSVDPGAMESGLLGMLEHFAPAPVSVPPVSGTSEFTNVFGAEAPVTGALGNAEA